MSNIHCGWFNVIGAEHDGDIFPTDPTKISKRSGTLLKRQKR
jgi:hypothetical protein